MARNKFTSPKLKVTITPEMYDQAVRSSSGGCLISDAIKRQYKDLTRVSTDMVAVRATDQERGERYTWFSPPAVQDLLLGFDQGATPDGPVEVVIQRAVHIAPITRSSRNAADARSRTEARIKQLEAKERRGQQLTRAENAALKRMKNPANTAPRRPTSTGSPEVRVGRDGRTTVRGGSAPRTGRAHPNLLRSYDRHFGAKLADPGVVFKNAVEQEVARRLAEKSAEDE